MRREKKFLALLAWTAVGLWSVLGALPLPSHAAPSGEQVIRSRTDDDLITLAVRLEPIGPTTAVKVPRSARMEEVKEEALRRLAVPPAEAQKCVIAQDGRLLDESKKVGDFGFGEMAFLSVGLLDDVYIDDRDWRSGGP